MSVTSIIRRNLALPLIVISLSVISLESAAVAQQTSSPTSRSSNGLIDVLEQQIVLNSLIQVHFTPRLDIDEGWKSSIGWETRDGDGALGYLLMVRVDHALIDAATVAWAKSVNANSSEEAAAHADLLRRFPVDEGEFFLLFASPLREENYPEWFRYRLVGFPDDVSIVSLDGKKIAAINADYCPKTLIEFNDPIFSCLLQFPKLEDIDDPYFYVEIPIEHQVRQNGGSWTSAPIKAISFRVELGTVPLIALVNRGVDWGTIEEDYIRPHLRSTAIVAGDQSGSILIDLATNLVSAVLLRGLKI